MKDIEEQLRALGYDMNALYQKYGNTNPDGWQDFLYDIQRIIDDGKVKRLTITNYSKLLSKYMYDNTFTILYVEEEKDEYVIMVEYEGDTFRVKLSRLFSHDPSSFNKGCEISTHISSNGKRGKGWIDKEDMKTPEKLIKYIDSFITYNLAPLPF